MAIYKAKAERTRPAAASSITFQGDTAIMRTEEQDAAAQATLLLRVDGNCTIYQRRRTEVEIYLLWGSRPSSEQEGRERHSRHKRFGALYGSLAQYNWSGAIAVYLSGFAMVYASQMLKQNLPEQGVESHRSREPSEGDSQVGEASQREQEPSETGSQTPQSEVDGFSEGASILQNGKPHSSERGPTENLPEQGVSSPKWEAALLRARTNRKSPRAGSQLTLTEAERLQREKGAADKQNLSESNLTEAERPSRETKSL